MLRNGKDARTHLARDPFPPFCPRGRIPGPAVGGYLYQIGLQIIHGLLPVLLIYLVYPRKHGPAGCHVRKEYGKLAGADLRRLLYGLFYFPQGDAQRPQGPYIFYGDLVQVIGDFQAAAYFL